MQIDRTRFLLLASTLAAGCSAAATNGTEPTVATPVEVQPSSDGEPVAVDQQPVEPAGPVPSTPEKLMEECRNLQPPPGPHCESFYDTKSTCEAFVNSLEPQAAEEAVECLSGRSGTPQICRFDAVQKCFIQGTSVSVGDGSHQKRCQSVVSRCANYSWAPGDLNMSSCGSVLASVKDHLEEEMLTCMAEGCGLSGCVWSLP